MKGLASLFFGIFGTFAFSWLGLTVIPNLQIGALNPQMDEEGTDIYPAPKSGMAQRGRQVYAANGCMYCHSQQVRPDYLYVDIDRKWGVRRSAPRDYIFERPVLLGQERMGPDLANVGKRGPVEEEKPAAAPGSNPPAASPAAAQSPPPPNAAPAKPPAAVGTAPQAAHSPAQAPPPAQPAAANPSPSPSASPNSQGLPQPYSEMWHHLHLYSPRTMSPDNRDSTMPAFRYLYQEQRIEGERSADALPLKDREAPAAGYEVVPTYDAKCLVAYLMSLDQTHSLKEVKNIGAPAPAAAGSPAAPAAGSPPPAAPTKR
jgi:cbb3-type cytochrome oxidase cytochrome c subunit